MRAAHAPPRPGLERLPAAVRRRRLGPGQDVDGHRVQRVLRVPQAPVHLRAGRARRGAPRHRARAPGHHRPRVRRAAALRGEIGGRRQGAARGGLGDRGRQRRDLQLQGPVRQARGGRLPLQAQDGLRLRGAHPALRQVRPREGVQSPPRHVLVRALRPAHGLLRGRARPHRHHVPVPGPGPGRLRVGRVGDEGHRARLHGGRAVQAGPLLEVGLQVLQPLVRALVAGGRPADGGVRLRQAARGLREGRGAPHDVGRALGRAAVGRPRLVARRVGRAARAQAQGRRRRRSLDGAPALVLRRSGGLAGPRGGRGGGQAHRHHPPPLHLHAPGGPGRGRGGHPPPGDVRRHDGARGHAHVPHGAQDQGHGRQDGAVRRGRGRDPRRLPLLPQGAQQGGAAGGAHR
mmetsp:Transcript_12209/g.36267  ORF Transcript_12209/g.36267 Transcript_12209/m.36267 type:complete len:403 (+) Transcript_12209:225-1433(+)